VTGDLRVGGGLFERLDRKLGGAHGRVGQRPKGAKCIVQPLMRQPRDPLAARDWLPNRLFTDCGSPYLSATTLSAWS
jgi:hypothetical protein